MQLALRGKSHHPRQQQIAHAVAICCNTSSSEQKEGEHGESEELFRQLDQGADAAAFARLVRACGTNGALPMAKRVHAHIVEAGFGRNLLLGNHLVNMYAKCGSLEDAEAVFQAMPERNTVSWNSVISAFAQQDRGEDGIGLFRQMQLEGQKPNGLTFVSLLNARPPTVKDGILIHACAFQSGCATSDVAVGTAVLNMLAKCGNLHDARRVFDGLLEPNAVSWTAMIAAYAQNGHCREAFVLFRVMQLEGLNIDEMALVCALTACASPADLAEVQLIHSHIVERGYHVTSCHVANALIDLYGKCRCLEAAQSVFDGIPMQKRNVVTWTVMIAAYAQTGHCTSLSNIIGLFRQMQFQGTKPDSLFFVAMVDACASMGNVAEARFIHALAVQSGYEVNAIVANALIHMNATCGNLDDAEEIFNRMPHQGSSNIHCWNSIIGGHLQRGDAMSCLRRFRMMQLEGKKPNSTTFELLLSACSGLASSAESKLIQSCILESELRSDPIVGNALVNMYGKHGNLGSAHEEFSKLQLPDVSSWNSLITANAHHGQAEQALRLFHQMQAEGGKPTSVTFVSIVSACNHAGLLKQGLSYFVSMNSDHGIAATGQHFACIVDLLARASQLSEAEEFINRMPIAPGVIPWMTLLSACRNRNDVERGERAASHVFAMDPLHAPAYVALISIYAAVGRWQDAAKVKQAMVDKGVLKEPGWSRLELNNKVQEFVKSDTDIQRLQEKHTHKYVFR